MIRLPTLTINGRAFQQLSWSMADESAHMAVLKMYRLMRRDMKMTRFEARHYCALVVPNSPFARVS